MYRKEQYDLGCSKDSGMPEDLNAYLKDESTKASHGTYVGVLPCQDREHGMYPNVDFSVWLRSCTQEVECPIQGTVKGTIPSWLSGNLLQNGPGKCYYGEKDIFNHLFDGSALLQKYIIREGQVQYQCRFLQTASFIKNIQAGRIATSEFGTNANTRRISEDEEQQHRVVPTQILHRIANMRSLEHIMSDNANISVYPFGSEHYCFYESPFLQVCRFNILHSFVQIKLTYLLIIIIYYLTCNLFQRLDAETLATMEMVDLNKAMGVITNAAHPHFEEDGSMLALGLTIGLAGPHYVINKIPMDPNQEDSSNKLRPGLELGAPWTFQNSKEVARIKSRWTLNPSYMHSFSVTENYYILIEQPLCVNVPKLVKSMLSSNGAVIDGMVWYEEAPTIFHVIPKTNAKTSTGKTMVYQSDAFFFLHT